MLSLASYLLAHHRLPVASQLQSWFGERRRVFLGVAHGERPGQDSEAKSEYHLVFRKGEPARWISRSRAARR